MIPFVNLSAIHHPLKNQFQEVLDNCLNQSDFVVGDTVKKFEKEFADFCNTTHAVGVSSGTAALFLTLLALDVKTGDEVIVPSHTFVATAMAVSQCGAKPVFADVHPTRWNITLENISEKITSRTKGIIAVHLYGNPAEMEDIVEFSKSKSLFVLEDAAQAHGARYRDKPVGSLADAACFSFYPSKNLGALGEGGMVTTNNSELADKILRLRDYGRSDKYRHDFIGYNLRLQAVQAGFLSVKLPFLNQWNEERRRLMKLYRENLKDTAYRFQEITPNSLPVYHLGVITVPDREKVTRALEKENIGYGIHYPIACHQQPAYRDSSKLPASEYLADTVLSLPLYIGLKDPEVQTVCEVLKSLL